MSFCVSIPLNLISADILETHDVNVCKNVVDDLNSFPSGEDCGLSHLYCTSHFYCSSLRNTKYVYQICLRRQMVSDRSHLVKP